MVRSHRFTFQLARTALRPLLRVYFPWVVLVAGLGIWAASPTVYAHYVESEFGFIENATVLLLLPSILIGLAVFRSRASHPLPWIGWWALLMTVACLYFGGEEISWGQHWFGWETPDAIAAVNAQQETNLHNMSSWFNEKPRLVLELSICIGFVWAALYRARWQSATPHNDWQYWMLPSFDALSVAILTVVIQYPERIQRWSGTLFSDELNVRFAEYQELFFSVCLLCYLSSIHVRLTSLSLQDEGANSGPVSDNAVLKRAA